MEYKEKYLIYKTKYLTLKNKLKKQRGGSRFKSVPNNGGGEVGFSQQCIWISIRDYLNYHRGVITTATELKRSIGLGLETDKLEYDDDNVILKDGLIRLAERLGISLCFIYTRHDGSIAPYCLNEDGTLKPFRIINRNTGNNVYIATFGRHFELLIEGPNYILEHHKKSSINGSKYQPKVKIHQTYVSDTDFYDINDEDLIKANIQLANTIETIDFLKSELKRVTLTIDENEKSLENIDTFGLNSEQKALLKSSYESMLKENELAETKLRSQIDKLKLEKQSLELIVNS